MFMVFLAVSGILWTVLSLNEEEQSDIRMPLKITHVPDSVTMISLGPDALSVSLRAKGTQLMKMSFGGAPTVNVDFRAYARKGLLQLNNADLRVVVDDRNEKIGRKIRDNELRRIPYMLIVGEKEAENGEVSVRKQGEGDKGTMKIATFADEIARLVNDLK